MRRVGILYERREDRAFEELSFINEETKKIFENIFEEEKIYYKREESAPPPLSLSLVFPFLITPVDPSSLLPYRDQRGEGTRIVQRGNTIAEDTEYGKNLICLLERGGGGGYRSDISRRRGGEWNRTDTVCPVR